MDDPIKRALTHRTTQRGHFIDDEPNEKLILGVKFAIAITAMLSTLEIFHMVFMQTWNSEIFAAIAGLSGTITGIFVGQKT
jgi:hypothetical protein